MPLQSSALRSLVIGGLLFSLGGVIGYRYQLVKGGSNDNPLPIFKLQNVAAPQEYQDVDFGQFWKVWQILDRDYVDPQKLDQTKMVNGAIAGMTSALGDPYTMYLPPVEQKRTTEDLQGSFYGIGIQLGYVDSTLAVVAPLKGNPAEVAGIKAGDLILHVKDDSKKIDEDTTGWSLPDAVDKIRGEKGTAVTLTLFRKDNGDKPFTVSVKRDEIVVPSVELSFVENNGKKVAHVSLSRFGDRTKSELDEIVSKILIEKPNIAGIVLDLRNNPGGYFDAAIDVAGEFVKDGVVVSEKGKIDQKDFRAKGQARLANIPVILVVNKGSASASEILAGALKDLRATKLVGEKTFGKGTVQDARQLENGAGLHVTVARWLLPKGEWIHETGIPVDVEVKDDPDTEVDEVLNKAIETL
jgi:carboxyl-terminal processing protease